MISLLTDPDTIDKNKICAKVPAGPPARGQWTFVLNLEKIEVSDLPYDSMGSWGKPSGRSWFYCKEDDMLDCVSRSKMPPNWDFRIKLNRYNHPGTKSAKFSKQIFVTENRDRTSYCPFAVICYDAMIAPSEVQIVAHKNAKDKEKAMPRTKPIVC